MTTRAFPYNPKTKRYDVLLDGCQIDSVTNYHEAERQADLFLVLQAAHAACHTCQPIFALNGQPDARRVPRALPRHTLARTVPTVHVPDIEAAMSLALHLKADLAMEWLTPHMKVDKRQLRLPLRFDTPLVAWYPAEQTHIQIYTVRGDKKLGVCLVDIQVQP